MTKTRDLADFVSAGNPLADGTIDVADINGVTATTTEINYLDGVTSNIQSQFDGLITDLVSDTTPQLGGDLDLNSSDITGTGNINITGNLSLTGTVDGRDIASDGSKLDGVESGATADQTASEILTAIKTVDGAASGLDADLLDGQQGTYYLDANNFTNMPAGGIGSGQSWSLYTGSRSAGTTYTNSTGTPIMVSVYGEKTATNAQGQMAIEVDGIEVNRTFVTDGWSYGAFNCPASVVAIVPNSSTYKINLYSAAQINFWAELR